MTEEKVHHIAFGVDEAFFRGTAVLITSIAENNAALPIVFHVFTFDCTDENKERLTQLASCIKKEIRLHLLGNKLLATFEHYKGLANYPPSSLIRLFIPEELSGVTEKVLYLDSDILCFGDISELLAEDFGDNIAAVVAEIEEERVITLRLKNGKYFNAGVMYIDIKKWIAAGISNTALKEVASKYMPFADQDALNIILDGHIKFLDEKWNFVYYSIAYMEKGEVTMNIQSPYVFVHFIGPLKPWNKAVRNDWQRHFIEVQSRTPWASSPFDYPKRRGLKLFTAKFMFRRGHYGAGVYWFFLFAYDMVIFHIYNKCLKKISSLPFFSPNFKNFLLSKTIKIS